MLYHRKCQRGFGRDYRSFSHLAVIGSTLTALTTGFGLAVMLSLHAGLGWSVGDWWTPTIQAHGHVQLIGWLGLFIVGVSLFFVPRLSGVPLKHPWLVPWSVSLLLAGVVLRGLLQPVAWLLPPDLTAVGLMLSAVLEALGVAIYLFLILTSVVRAGNDRAALALIRPYLVTTVIGWIGFTMLNVDLSFGLWSVRGVIYDLAWTRHATELYLGATLIPVCLAFSVRTFPLYLRLPAARWGVQAFGIGYLVVFALSWVFDVLPDWDERRTVSGISHALKGILLLLFVWKLDVLLRLRDPWTTDQIAEPSTGARPTRPGLPDHGEFGAFERLLYLAYGWLVVGAALEVVLGVYRLFGAPEPIDADGLRHVFLAGFVSSLLIGMAPRMVPGFVHERTVAYPALVNVTFWLWAPATLARILPLLLSPLLPPTDLVMALAGWLFALSGVFGWCAVACLSVNLWMTLRRAGASTSGV